VYKRDHFENKPFRLLYNKVREYTQRDPGTDLEIDQVLFHQFFLHHWLIPYPDGNGTLISTQYDTGARQFYASAWMYPQLTKKQRKQSRRPAQKEWCWAQGHVRRGQPAAYPVTLGLNIETVRKRLLATK
jgi:hypothetical protein